MILSLLLTCEKAAWEPSASGSHYFATLKCRLRYGLHNFFKETPQRISNYQGGTFFSSRRTAKSLQGYSRNQRGIRQTGRPNARTAVHPEYSWGNKDRAGRCQ